MPVRAARAADAAVETHTLPQEIGKGSTHVPARCRRRRPVIGIETQWAFLQAPLHEKGAVGGHFTPQPQVAAQRDLVPVSQYGPGVSRSGSSKVDREGRPAVGAGSPGIAETRS